MLTFATRVASKIGDLQSTFVSSAGRNSHFLIISFRHVVYMLSLSSDVLFTAAVFQHDCLLESRFF